MSLRRETLLDDGGLKAACYGRVFLNAWLAPPTVERLEALRVVQRRYVDGNLGNKHITLSLVDPGVGKEMSGAARSKAKEVGDEMLPWTQGHCFVVLGSGFFAAMARSVIAGIQLVGQGGYAWKVLSSIDEGVLWTTGELARAGAPHDGPGLREVIADVLGKNHPAVGSPERAAAP